MRVNVLKSSISKTLMYGLKVSLQQRQLIKSNKKSLEFYNLNLDKLIKQTLITLTSQLVVVALVFKVLAKFATFANVHNLIQLLISFNVFNCLTVLMNDFRLKIFYCKLNKSNKTSTTSSSKIFSSPLTSAAATKNLKLSATSLSSSSSATLAFVTSATVLKQTSSKFNNHHRTYNNSSKSNKVFLYYTPRDPRLRIFLKTKHFHYRPQQQQQQSSLYGDKSFNFFCNYGELSGGNIVNHKTKRDSGVNNSSNNNKNNNNKNNNKTKCYNNLKKAKEICDRVIDIKSDNLIIAFAGAANETSSANILNFILIVAVLSEYTKELFKSIEILLSFHNNNHQQLRISKVKSHTWFK